MSRENTMDNNRFVNALARRTEAHLDALEDANRDSIELLDRWGDELADSIREMIREEIAAVSRPEQVSW